MKRQLAYVTAPWDTYGKEKTKRAASYCRKLYEAGYTPICPLLSQSTFINDRIPAEHKDGIDMSHDLLSRANVLVICDSTLDETVKNDIALAKRKQKTATTLDGILAVEFLGQCPMED